MKDQLEQSSSVIKDIPPLALGGGFIGYASFAKATEIVQQLGIWFGTALVLVTLLHRLYIFYRDTRK